LGDLVLFNEQLILNSYEIVGLKEGGTEMKNAINMDGVP